LILLKKKKLPFQFQQQCRYRSVIVCLKQRPFSIYDLQKFYKYGMFLLKDFYFFVFKKINRKEKKKKGKKKKKKKKKTKKKIKRKKKKKGKKKEKEKNKPKDN